MKQTLALVLPLVAALGCSAPGARAESSKPDRDLLRKRNEALARARILRDEPFDASRLDFADDPNRGVVDATLTSCKYQPDEISGTSPKFDCLLANGEKVKVKYSWTREIPSEIAATRLLRAMGFGADRVSPVETVRCYGCPFQPYHMRSIAEKIGLDNYLDKRINYSAYRDFTRVSVERKLDGEEVEVGEAKGWAFHELKMIDPAKGGAARAEVDALRLMAAFLHHWDNKAPNQRLLCVDSRSAECDHPLAMIQDAGSDFGPKKVSLEDWRGRPVWADPTTCAVSMKQLPYDGGTFEDVRISEGGRRLLGNRLKQLSTGQITTLFQVARLDDVPGWVGAFQDRVRQITERSGCPS